MTAAAHRCLAANKRERAEHDVDTCRVNNNRAAVPEHPRFLENWARRSASWRERHPPLTLFYADSERAWVDVFPAADGAPLHVFLHGGYWQALDARQFSFMAEAFNACGECAVIVNYDLCPDTPLAAIVDQLRQAWRWIVREAAGFGADARQVQVTGHSAGAHLLACLLTDGGAPTLCRANALSGIYDLRPLLPTQINDALGLDAASARALSPLLMSPDCPDTRLDLWVGSLESAAYHAQSRDLAEAWKDKVNIQSGVFDGVHHFSILDAFIEQAYRPLPPRSSGA